MHQVLAYLKFLWHSKNEYAVHSPFVYELLMKCVYDKSTYPDYAQLERYRKSLLADKTEIAIEDLGAGSRILKNRQRKVCDMAANAGSTAFRSKLLFRLTQYLQPENSLELGTSLGIGTLSLALGNPQGRVTTVEGSATAGYAHKKLGEIVNNTKVIQSDFASFIEKLPSEQKYDLVFFDGHHDRDATLRYFEAMKKTVREGTAWIFDDIHWSPGMEQAWQKICDDPAITVSIDTFQWGIVFFRSGQVKEHFVLRT